MELENILKVKTKLQQKFKTHFLSKNRQLDSCSLISIKFQKFHNFKSNYNNFVIYEMHSFFFDFHLSNF